MQQASPDKEFIFAPTRQLVEDCNCEAECPWMKLNSLGKIYQSLLSQENKIELPGETIEKALVPLERMLSFRK
jgi:quinolinate synthase